MLAGYFFVYVATPRDLDWQLATSCARLMTQLWPAALFLLFAVTPRESELRG